MLSVLRGPVILGTLPLLGTKQGRLLVRYGIVRYPTSAGETWFRSGAARVLGRAVAKGLNDGAFLANSSAGEDLHMAFLMIGPPGNAPLGDCIFEVTCDQTSSGPSLTAGWLCLEGGAVEIYADRLGMIPIFYALFDAVLLVSDSLKEITSHLPRSRPDDDAISVFLSLGYYVGDTTPVQSVKVLGPGQRVSWKDGEVVNSIDQTLKQSPYLGSTADAIEDYQRLFNTSVGRRIPKGVGVLPISGGRDSRHILLELVRQHAPPPCVLTLESPEASSALTLAMKVGVECRVASREKGVRKKHIEKNRLNHYLADENAWYLDVLPHLFGTLFDGLGGDVLSNGLYYDSQLSGLIREGKCARAAELLTRWHDVKTRFLCRRFRKLWCRERAATFIESELSKYSECPNPLKEFIFWNRTRREIALIPIAMAMSRVPVVLPYVDDELLSFLLSLPEDPFGSIALHDAVIQRAYPDARSVPYGNDASKAPSPLGLRHRAAFIRETLPPLVGEIASIRKMLTYAAEVALTGRQRPLMEPFDRVMPVSQLLAELNLEW